MGFVPELSWEFCALTPEVRDDKGWPLSATQVDRPLEGFDLVIVPGGFGTRELYQDAAFTDWMKTAAPTPLKASVCTGGLLLGAAGFLQGKKATTHPTAYDLLRPFCAEVIENQRVVDQGEVVTARGVSAGLDLGLYLCERIGGAEAKAKIKVQMDYPYGP